MDTPDFRIKGRIFATLYGQQRSCGVLKLTPEQQQAFIADQPHAFSPVQGGWGRMGMTFVHLNEADDALIEGALTTAFHNVQKKQSRPGSSAKAAKSPKRRLQ
jgi:hypothetical protein